MRRLAALYGIPSLLVAAGLAISGCVAVGPTPGYYTHAPYRYYAGPPRHYYTPVPTHNTFVFSYRERDRDRGRPHRHHHRHWR